MEDGYEMSFESLVNVVKCATCSNMVPLGRLPARKERQCQACLDKIQRAKKRLQAKIRYRAKNKKYCIACQNEITCITGWRKELCLDCQEVVKKRYTEQKCIYCQAMLKGNPNAKFCSHTCQLKTLYIVYGRKK